jgi:hypothetical protein
MCELSKRSKLSPGRCQPAATVPPFVGPGVEMCELSELSPGNELGLAIGDSVDRKMCAVRAIRCLSMLAILIKGCLSCTGTARPCEAMQRRCCKTAPTSRSYLYSSTVFGVRRGGKWTSLVTTADRYSFLFAQIDRRCAALPGRRFASEPSGIQSCAGIAAVKSV